MPDYRAFTVGHDGKYIASEIIVALNDTSALRIAKRLVDGHDIELWQGNRKIGVLHHE